MFHERDTDHWTRDCPIFTKSKKKMAQTHNQPSTTTTVKDVNHTFVLPSAFQPLPRVPIQLPQTSFIVLLAIQLHTPADNHLPYDTSTNNVSRHKLSNHPTKDRPEQPTSTAQSRILPTCHQFPSLWNQTHHHRRFQLEFSKQEAEARVLSLGQLCRS
jgi:hypothetical protein